MFRGSFVGRGAVLNNAMCPLAWRSSSVMLRSMGYPLLVVCMTVRVLGVLPMPIVSA